MQTTLHLAKQNFKFSAAHFLIFDQHRAEMLHGHNYQVQVEVVGAAAEGDDSSGYLIDFGMLKTLIKKKLDEWDEHILLPEKHPDMKFALSASGQNYEINFRDRFYSFPTREVIWLPINNTSVELLSYLLAQDFYEKFKTFKIEKVRVSVEETSGQKAWVEVP